MTDTKQAAYAVTFILGNSDGKGETHTKHFKSIAEVRSWANYHNYVIGKPQLHVATYSIEHANGSPITHEELQALQPENSETLYRKRMSDVVLPGGVRVATGLHEGVAQAAIRQSGIFAGGKNE